MNYFGMHVILSPHISCHSLPDTIKLKNTLSKSNITVNEFIKREMFHSNVLSHYACFPFLLLDI